MYDKELSLRDDKVGVTFRGRVFEEENVMYKKKTARERTIMCQYGIITYIEATTNQK